MILITGPEIAAYGFPGGHPFGPDRHAAFLSELERSDCFGGLERRPAPQASRERIEYFHTSAYVDLVQRLSERGSGLLDQGDTPAFPGVYEAAAHVVGGTL
ncbi:MAG TPA: acetoin utilization protein AcuC, partial [Gammaproteobacteria bacterium]|nr:acetoin utilization protein AcuC [Gammaproteobacteria bacterium]